MSRNTPIILRIALLAWVARKGTSVGGANEVLSCAAGTAVANSMTKQSALETSSCSSFTGGDLDDEALEEARAEGDALVTVGGGRECDGVLLSSWIV